MDATANIMCQEDPVNPVVSTCLQVCGILVVSHLFHLIFKPLGQPGPVAQVLAGLVLGPTMLCRIYVIERFFIKPNSAEYYRFYAFFARIFFMFLLGLEFDVPFMKRNLHLVTTVAYGGFMACGIFGAAISWFIIRELTISYNKIAFAIVTIILIANSASPVVIRLAADLKLDTSDVGRLAMSSSLINEMSCSLLFSLVVAFTEDGMFKTLLLSIFLTASLILVNCYLVIWFNTKSRNQKFINNSQVLLILVLLISVSMIIESSGLYSTVHCFLVGMMFPREGKTTRTLLHKLTYAVHNFVLPSYFGFTGFQFNMSSLSTIDNVIVALVMVSLSIAGKILGTLLACYYLKIPLNIEAVILAFILNLKGHADLVVVDASPNSEKWWGEDIRRLLLSVIVLNTLMAGPVVSFIMRKQEVQLTHNRTSIECIDPESELRMICCVYKPRNASGQLGLCSALRGKQGAAITPYLMHLVELPKRRKKKNLMYHQLQDGDQFSDEDEYGGNDVMEINEAVDIFSSETKIFVRQIKAVSSFPTMYEDVCSQAEDLRVSLIFLPFHKHQRIDGKMEKGKDEMRSTNQKIIRHAPCSVGILVDRGCLEFQRLLAPDSLQSVATLFFGGPDDREAIACSKRLAMHHHLNLTVIRFLPSEFGEEDVNVSSSTASPHFNLGNEVFMSIARRNPENKRDDVYMDEFYKRYVSSGQIGYVEKNLRDGAETLQALRDIGDMYSLFIVGKGRRGCSPLTTGMSDWEECPELGVVGDLLASMDFDIKSSVLVIQQHRHTSSKSFTDD